MALRLFSLILVSCWRKPWMFSGGVTLMKFFLHWSSRNWSFLSESSQDLIYWV